MELKVSVFTTQPRWKQFLLNLLPDRSFEQPEGSHRYGKYWRGTVYEKGGNFYWGE